MLRLNREKTLTRRDRGSPCALKMHLRQCARLLEVLPIQVIMVGASSPVVGIVRLLERGQALTEAGAQGGPLAALGVQEQAVEEGGAREEDAATAK